MDSKRLVTTLAAVFAVSLFLIPPAFACYFPGPEGSSVLVTVKTSDGTPIPGAYVTLKVINGSRTVTSVGPEGTDCHGQFTFPGPDNVVEGLTYKVHATHYGDEVSAECSEGPEHSADSATFSLSAGQQKSVEIIIPGVSVAHGATATPCPTPSKPGENCDKPYVPKNKHYPYPPMEPGQSPGTVAGVILGFDGKTPLRGVYVAIVSAADPSVEYSGLYTDSNGFFMFYNVNSTAGNSYKLFAAKSCDVKAYSGPFGVNSGQTTILNLYFSRDGNCTFSLKPVVDPTKPPQPPAVSPSALPTPPAPPGINELTTTSSYDGGFLEQITGLITGAISRILPGI